MKMVPMNSERFDLSKITVVDYANGTVGTKK